MPRVRVTVNVPINPTVDVEVEHITEAIAAAQQLIADQLTDALERGLWYVQQLEPEVTP